MMNKMMMRRSDDEWDDDVEPFNRWVSYMTQDVTKSSHYTFLLIQIIIIIIFFK